MNDNSNISYIQKNPSPDEITRRGQEIYFSELQSKLEPAHIGEYVVIEVDSKDYFLDKDLVNALTQAEVKYPSKLFFIVQIGTLNSSMRVKKQKYAWVL